MRPSLNRITRITTVAVLVSLLAAATTNAYFMAFSQFAPYDDEGYILQTVRSYLDGYRLFDQVFTQYGPAFYVLESLIHTVLGAPLTQDFERFLTIGIWMASSLGCAAITWRLTRSSMAAAWTLIGVVVHLRTVVREPAHPQGLLGLIVTAVVLLSVSPWGSRPTKRCLAAMGGLAAVALLTKVNVGTFLLLGVALPLILTSRLPRSPWIRSAQVGICVAACALPLLVMRNDIPGWALRYAVTVSGSLAAVLIAIAASSHHDRPASRLAVYAGACAVAAALLLVPSLWRGTSLLALWNGIVVRPSQLPELYQLAFYFPRRGPALALASVVLAYVALARKGAAPGPSMVAWGKLGAACVGLYALRAGFYDAVPVFTPLLWVSIPAGRQRPDHEAFGRHVLTTTAVLQVMQAYPVAGSQRAFATFLMLPIVFTLAHDGITMLLREEVWRPRYAAAVAPLAILAAGLWLHLPGDLDYWHGVYHRNYALRLPGGEHLRLPAKQVARFQWLTANVADRCGTLLSLPGLFSLNAWSHVEPPGQINVGAWVPLLTETERALIWRHVEASPRACAVYNRSLAAWWTKKPVGETSAPKELQARFVRHSAFDGYEFFVRPDHGRPRPPVRLFLGRQAFEPETTPLPVVPALLQQPQSSIRLWFRTRSPGVVVGCQSEEHVSTPSKRWVPLVYVGGSGRLYGQYWNPAFEVQATRQPVNDGAWHHAVLVNDSGRQRFFVDGELVGATTSTVGSDALAWCQVGAGTTSGWPDTAPDSGLRGEVENLAVASHAWSAADVAADRASTLPRDGTDR